MTWYRKGSKSEALFLAHLMVCWTLERGPDDALRVMREGKGERTVLRGFRLIDRAIVKASREMSGA